MKRIGVALMVVAMVSLLAQAVQADIVLVAGWDDGFSGSTGWSANYLEADTTATVVATTEHNPWSNWNFNDQGGSDDGTFGDLSTSVASATTAYTGAGRNLSLNRSNGTLVFTLTNDSALDRTVDGFYFDSVHRFSDSADAWALTYSGAISGTGASGALSQEGAMSTATAANRDKAVDLSGLTDNVWEAGTDAVFTLAFTGAANSSSGGGQELLVDNIGITADVIPEPATMGMLGIAALAIAWFRKRFVL